ncbi:hypothetical protein GF325_13080 [Candidatus Bathyarchaeota archaeon]|nr:hypothetical protein [Candidatus Bathyarchaeota archaeon]
MASIDRLAGSCSVRTRAHQYKWLLCWSEPAMHIKLFTGKNLGSHVHYSRLLLIALDCIARRTRR